MRPNAKVPENAHVTLIARIVVFLGCVLPFLRVLSHGFIAVDDQMHTYLNPFLNGHWRCLDVLDLGVWGTVHSCDLHGLGLDPCVRKRRCYLERAALSLY
jgi:hypothetical protein